MAAAQAGTLAAQLQAVPQAGRQAGAPLVTLPLQLSRRIPLEGAELEAWHERRRAAALEAAASPPPAAGSDAPEDLM